MSTPIGIIFRDIQRAQRLADFGFKEDLVTAGLLAGAELSRACDWQMCIRDRCLAGRVKHGMARYSPEVRKKAHERCV